MDTKEEIKNSLISKIEESDDLDFLKALETIFDTSERSLYELSPEQINSIQKGREDIKNGKFIDNDKLISEMKSWLTKK